MEKLHRILYVEDDPSIRMVAELALVTLGKYTLRTCESGYEALECAPQFNPQLIILDMMMPGIDGIKTLELLRSIPQTADTPVIFMTAKIQPDEIAHYMALGALSVIAKPFDPLNLITEIEQHWANYHER